MLQRDYIERVYAGVLGKTIGVRHGSNIEGWSFEKIRHTYGEINDYLFDFKNFAADDDTNGAFLLLRALTDYCADENVTCQNIADTLLNYAPDHHGFFWWGPYGVSAENTAYTNLAAGVPASLSGSAQLNGMVCAEQIGGQIFIDGWGLVAPANEVLAAKLAQKSASVTHDHNGIYGGQFIAACVSAAFEAKNIAEVIERALACIPNDCTYSIMCRDIMRFYEAKPDTWEECLYYIRRNWWQDKYGGNCHIMPNSALMMLSMLYGKGDFSQTINICNMCGWDTDCNVANVGTILGVLVGLDGIDAKWRAPIGDFLAYSSVLGAQNITNLAAVANGIAAMGYRMCAQEVPARLFPYAQGKQYMDFTLPGSTQAMRVQADGGAVTLVQRSDIGNGGGLAVHAVTGDEGILYLYHQTYYSPSDFNDSRYDPSFSPIAYPGQTVRARVCTPQLGHWGIFYETAGDECIVRLPGCAVRVDEWMDVTGQLPAGDYTVRKTGLYFIPTGGIATLALDEFEIAGKADYAIDFAKERMEKWNLMHEEVSQFEFCNGYWRLADGCIHGSGGVGAEAYTGNPNWTDISTCASIVALVGAHHRLMFRVQGALRAYAVGLAPNGKLALYKKYRKYTCLAQTDFDWKCGTTYEIAVLARGNQFTISIDGVQILEYTDAHAPYLTGCVGLSAHDGSHISALSMRIVEVGA